LQQFAPRRWHQGVNVEFLAEYASFLAKTATLVIAILVVLSAIAGCVAKGGASRWQLQVTRLNDFYKELRERLESACSTRTSSRPCASNRPRRKSSRRRKARGQTPGVRAGLRWRHQGLGH
jgi:serine protease SohB